jgi:hypothetical protein
MAPEYRRAFVAVWIVLTVVSSAVVVFAALGNPAWLDGVVPVCEWKQRYGRECPFCGMTTAFFLIGDGRLADAAQANLASLPLFAAFCANGLAALAGAFRSKETQCSSSV